MKIEPAGLICQNREVIQRVFARMPNASMIVHGNAGFSCRNAAESLAFVVLYRDWTVAIPAAQWKVSRMLFKAYFRCSDKINGKSMGFATLSVDEAARG
jgi:hypothetical protein